MSMRDPRDGRAGAPAGSASYGAGAAQSNAGAAAPAAPQTGGAKAEGGQGGPGAEAAGAGAGQQGGSSLLPALTAPKGGGAIRGIGEKFSVNAATGTASLSVPLPVSPGRQGFAPMVDLSYDSGGGNGSFGLGFQLSVPTITRKTDKGLPRYYDEEESDQFILSGAEDLVPLRSETGAIIELARTLAGESYRVRRYRPRVEGLFANIERWIHASTRDAHWRVTTKDNITHVYGLSSTAAGEVAVPRLVDPTDPRRVFSWLLEESRDDKGNVVRYEYKAENADGVDPTRPSEKSRFERSSGTPVFTATAQRYLKRVLYCNHTAGVASDFLMELVFDYGEHAPFPTTPAAVPQPTSPDPWALRADPFSSYRSGFEVRSYRLCRRVLMFHRFSGAPLLVKSTDFTYEPGPAFTYLTGVTQAGYLNDASTGNAWRRDVLPTLVLAYERAILHDELSVLPPESLEGLEGGVDGGRKQWVDLDGEGIPGVLIDSDYAWYYKANRGEGKLVPPRVLSSLPSPALLASGVQHLEDLGGDGQLDLVSYGEPLQGYFTRDQQGGFEGLRNFLELPNINFQDPNLRAIDLDGDGLPDLLITEDHAFVWYRSRGKEGFEPAQRLVVPSDDDRGPAVVFSDPEQSIQLADMSGDGLTDIVRVRNGEVSYWPNLGYGRFGKKITLENSPVIDHVDQFDARRVRFGDVDGSGTTDLFYLGRSGTTLYRNEAGNRLGTAERITSLPPADNITSVSIVDLLGKGTATLVWSSPLPGARSLFYVDLMGGKKPHLLAQVKNNLGAETRITYAPSTKFYLEDKQDPKTAWLTRLAFPVHVVERLERFDRISKSRLVSSYRYRHGYFDGVEREFRGFARVEQLDAEEFTASTETELFQAPVRTVSWYHTGAWLEKRRLEQALAAEYSQQGPSALLVRDTVFEPDTLSEPLTIQDEREAARALRGSLLRQEIYAEDGELTGDPDKAKLPYAITEQNFAVRRLQASKYGRHGVFLSHARESLAVHTERNPADPRIAHQLVLRVDEFGNVTRKASISYPRRPGSATLPEQEQLLATLSESAFINRPSPLTATDIPPENRWHRLGIEHETRAYEISALPAITTPGQLIYTFEQIDSALDTLIQNPTALNTVPYDGTPSGPGPQRRLLDKKQQLFYDDNLTGPLAPGLVESRALPYETYQQALSTGLVIFLAGEATTLTGVTLTPTALGTILTTEGGYTLRDGDYYSASGRIVFDATQFYLPIEAVDPFGNHYFTTYDAFSLLGKSTRDPLDNTVSVENDYRVLAPWKVIDPNLNVTEVAFDALGMVVATALMGKATGPVEGDTLANPTTRLVYDVLRFQTSGLPAFVHTIAREVHFAESATTLFQESYAYSDGFGRIAMQKVQAEPGPVPGMAGTVNPRWVGTGRTVFNNKGNPVKQYEPFFSATSDFEDEASLVATGVTPIIHYDPLDRVIRTELPNGTESRVEFDAWQQKTYDPSDAIAGTVWLSEHQAGTADEQRAAALALAHADTPTITHLDPLGRSFLVQADNGPDPATPSGPHRLYDTRTSFDLEGNVLSVTDARGIQVVQQEFDVLQRPLKVDSPDAGVRLAIVDTAGKPLRSWDSRAQTRRSRYDALQRPTHLYVALGATERLLHRTVFGEALDPPGVPIPTSSAQALNLRGRPYLTFDCTGLVTSRNFDFKGSLLASSRRLAVDYTTEPDWMPTENLTNPVAVLAAVSSLLETEHFDTSSTYDALNRITTHTTPDGSVTRPSYNEAGLLEALFASVRGAPEQTVVAAFDYNARGQRTSCQYGNGTTTSYTYDARTFQLTELETLRGATKLQRLVYTFDPAGNIVAMRDRSDTAPIFSGTAPVSADGLYEYDPLYRLVSATGREHPATQPIDLDPPAGTGIPHANDLQALVAYSETYRYDEVGNIEQLAHLAGPSGSLGWTRSYQYAGDSNRLLRTSVPGSPLNLSESYSYDAHGSMTSMPHLAVMDWDYADRLQHTQRGAGGGAQHTYFTYDAAGQRVRKVAVAAGTVKERIYLGGYEIYRERAAIFGAAVDFERQTLHVTDIQRRIALVETVTIGALNGSRIRFQLDNQLGSAILELDQAGAVISYEEYHAYGTTAFRSAEGAAGVSAKRYRYTGKERDEETGLYYYGGRYYAAWLARWTATDPRGHQGGINLYEYVKSNPVILFDPDGRQAAQASEKSESGWSWGKTLGLAAAIVVGVAVTALTGGLAGPIAAGVIGGIAAGAVGEVVEAAVDNRPITAENVVKSAVIGGLLGGAFAGAGQLLARSTKVAEFVAKAASSSVGQAVARVAYKAATSKPAEIARSATQPVRHGIEALEKAGEAAGRRLGGPFARNAASQAAVREGLAEASERAAAHPGSGGVKAAVTGTVDDASVSASTRSGVDRSGVGVRAVETPAGRVAAPTPESVAPVLVPKEVPKVGGTSIERGADAEFKLFGHILLSTERQSQGRLFLGVTAPQCPSCSANLLNLRAARPGLQIIDRPSFPAAGAAGAAGPRLSPDSRDNAPPSIIQLQVNF